MLINKNNRVDKDGFAVEEIQQSRLVFCCKKSVGYSEFYKAQQTGMSATLKIDLRTIDYEGEELVELDGKQYTVIRNYLSKNEEFIELTLSDLKKRSEPNGNF